MNRSVAAAVVFSVSVSLFVIGQTLAVESVDWLAGRFPGSARLASTGIDLAYLARGQLSRQSVFHTGADIGTVERWYWNHYGPISEGEAFAGPKCAGFRTMKLLARIQYAVAVTLCSLPAGTRIMIHESVFISPVPG